MNETLREDKRTVRVAIVVSHPIQHFVPFYRSLSADSDVDSHVFFGSRKGVEPYFDKEMNTEIKWNMDLTNGYANTFLSEERWGGYASPIIGSSVARFAPEVVVIYGYSSSIALRAMVWARMHKAKILMVSDSAIIYKDRSFRNVIKETVLPPLAKQVHAFLTVGDNNELYWASYGVPQDRMYRVPFTIDEGVFLDARKRREELRRRWRANNKIRSNETVFLAVGKNSPRKRQFDLLSALEKSVQAGLKNVRVVIAGSGPDRASLEAATRERNIPVTLLGFVNVDLLPTIYAASDVIVHPSDNDPHPLVLSEAACIGLPMIVSDRVGAVGPTDIARMGKNAMVFQSGDIESLASIMSNLANDPKLRESMSRSSLEIFETQNMDSSVNGFKRALRSVTTTSPRDHVRTDRATKWS